MFEMLVGYIWDASRTQRASHAQPRSSPPAPPIPGARFEPYLASIVPPLLAHAAHDVGIEATRVEERDGQDDDGINEVHYAPAPGGRGLVKLVVNKAQLEEKITALQVTRRHCCHHHTLHHHHHNHHLHLTSPPHHPTSPPHLQALYEYAAAAGASFVPFVQPVAERAAAEVEYKYHPSVREAAAHALAGCYRALVVAARAGPPITGEHVGQLLGALMKPLATALNHEREAAAADAMLDVFHDVLRYERETPLGVIQPTTLNAIVGLVKKQLEEDGKRTSERRQAAADDDDDDEPDEDELEAEFNLLSTAGACVREILKLGGAQALPTLETQLMPHINGWMAEVSDDAHRSLALVAYADLIELAGKENMKKVVPPVLNTALRLATVATADARLRQAAASAVGAAAEHAGKLLNRNAAAEAARALVAIVTAADAKCAANVGASSTAALAIGKLVVQYDAW